jgi:hypothetical protein
MLDSCRYNVEAESAGLLIDSGEPETSFHVFLFKPGCGQIGAIISASKISIAGGRTTSLPGQVNAYCMYSGITLDLAHFGIA